MRTRIRLAIARRLRELAQRLDPQPEIASNTSGGWTITMHGTPLAKITMDNINPWRSR